MSLEAEEDWWCSPTCQDWSRFCVCKKHVESVTLIECAEGKACRYGRWFHLDCCGLIEVPNTEDVWRCQFCRSEGSVDGVFEYTKGLLWMLLNDRLRRTAIREGNGPMLMTFWKDDGVHFWNEGYNKYLILMHRMIAGINGWLSERQAADLIWNRTVNLHGGAGRNVAMDKVNEFLNSDCKGQVERCSYLVGSVSRDLDTLFASNVAEASERQSFHRPGRHGEVKRCIDEYMTDNLFEELQDREMKGIKNISAWRRHALIKKPGDFKARPLKYSEKLDRGRYAATANSEDRNCDE